MDSSHYCIYHAHLPPALLSPPGTLLGHSAAFHATATRRTPICCRAAHLVPGILDPEGPDLWSPLSSSMAFSTTWRFPKKPDDDDGPRIPVDACQLTRHRHKTRQSLRRYTFALILMSEVRASPAEALSCTPPFFSTPSPVLHPVPHPDPPSTCLRRTTTSLWFRASRVPIHWHHPRLFFPSLIPFYRRTCWSAPAPKHTWPPYTTALPDTRRLATHCN
jgi:hypothetical protein